MGLRNWNATRPLRAAAQGQGVALARHRLAIDDLGSGLLRRPLDGLFVPLERAYWIVLPRHALPRPATEALIAWLKREAATQLRFAAIDRR